MSSRSCLASLPIALCAFALACTSATVTGEYSGSGLPRPDRVLVYDFAVTPGEVRLDRGLSAEVVEALKSGSRSQQEIELGHKVAGQLAEHLVSRIRKLGLPAQRADGEPPLFGNDLLIEGQFVSIDEGNRTERLIIGLGAGRTDVQTHVQVYGTTDDPGVPLVDIDISAKGGRTPGAAETMGIGALTGHLIISGVTTAASATGNETIGSTVEADADRTAKAIVEKLEPFFEREGWLE